MLLSVETSRLVPHIISRLILRSVRFMMRLICGKSSPSCYRSLMLQILFFVMLALAHQCSLMTLIWTD